MTRLKVALTGVSRGHKPGDEVSVEKGRAEALIRNNLAVPVTEAGKKLEREIADS